MEQGTVALVCVYGAMPAGAGATLRAYIHDSVLGILHAVQALLQALPLSGTQG